MKQKHVLLCVQSDIGRKNTIGFRFGVIAHTLQKNNISFDVIARANYDSDLTVQTPWYTNYVVRFLYAVHMYLLTTYSFRFFSLGLFDRFVLSCLKKSDCYYTIAHIGEFLPKTIRYLQQQGTKIFLDIPIGHDAYAKYLTSRGIVFGYDDGENTIPILNEAIHLADHLLLPSPFVRETLILAGFEKKQHTIIPFGASIDTTIGDHAIKKIYAHKKIKFLFAGNVNFRKGILYLLDAWEKIPHDRAELIICGRVFHEVFDMKKKYEKMGVHFPGFVDMSSYYKEADVFVFPSLWEGSAKAVYEAMSYGLPVITTYNAGSIVESGISGYIVPIADSAALAEKMNTYIQNKESIISMGNAAKESVRAYSWEQYGERVANSYYAVL